jgi:hypothetical protein
METVQKTLEIPSETLTALEKLAKITGAERGVPELIQDALRIYEWVVYQQANGNVVAAAPPLSPDQLKKFEAMPDIQVLEPLFDAKATEEAKRFFKAA